MTSPARPRSIWSTTTRPCSTPCASCWRAATSGSCSAFPMASAFWQRSTCTSPPASFLDCRMPGLSGPEVQQRLKAAQSPIAILFLTGHGEVPLAVESPSRGGGFLAKAGAAGPLLAAIERAEQATQAAATRLAQLAAFERLTPRERQLLQLIARGHKNQQIAQDLCISVRTVEVCRASLMKRLAVNSLAEMLLRYAQVNEQP